MKISKDWMSRRWFDLRVGHSNYFSFLLSFTNFLLIAYNFLIANLFDVDLFVFALVSVCFYVPAAVLVGHFHNTKQLKTDVAVQIAQNPYYEQILAELEEIKKEVKKTV